MSDASAGTCHVVAEFKGALWRWLFLVATLVVFDGGVLLGFLAAFGEALVHIGDCLHLADQFLDEFGVEVLELHRRLVLGVIHSLEGGLGIGKSNSGGRHFALDAFEPLEDWLWISSWEVNRSRALVDLNRVLRSGKRW
jgi:hypothetical protein